MKYETIADIYTASAKVRERTLQVAATISAAEATALPADEKWSVQEIFEHMATVDGGAIRIAAKLIEGARESGKVSDGSFSLTSDFSDKSVQIADLRVEAPDRVKPTGDVSIAETLAKLDENVPAFAALQGDLERIDCSEPRFPHPFFGDLTAAEWLVIKNGHEARHTAQIERLLAKIRA